MVCYSHLFKNFHSLLFLSSPDGCLNCFHLLAPVVNPAMSICIQVLTCVPVFNSFGHGNSYMVILCFTL